MPTTALDVITNALLEIGVYSQGESLSAEDANFGLSRLNRILDSWNAKKLFCYADVFATYALTVGQQSRTIGPAGNYVVTVRPVEIISANIVDTSVTPNIRIPMNIRDAAWWAGVAVRAISTSYPSDLYYSPDWPEGTLYMWPKPSAAFQIELETRGILSGLALLTTTFSFPPGYEEAITLTLAEKCCRPFLGRPADGELVMSAATARATIQGQNSNPPRISTRDSGMPNGGSNRSGYNIRTGMNN